MSILSFEYRNCSLVITFSILALVIITLLLCAFFLIKFLLKKYSKNNKLSSMIIDEAKLGTGSNCITLKFDNRDKEVAYKLWIEMTTRKIGLVFDEENDVIVEIYDSWYEFFKITRELIKDIPFEKKHTYQLIELTKDVLNKGLRPHLTKWQAKYRKWYALAAKNSQKTPQEIQREYPEYKELVNDLKRTNQNMLEYSDLLHSILM
ncbi:MAG: hypothetical protein IJI67_01635 [Clostridia bacterium]|nr:hypothetical protein [Clostridia bacterium]